MQKIVVLLDLNYTLAKKIFYVHEKLFYDVSKDVYSQELVDQLMTGQYEIHLVTARPEKYRGETMMKIARETGLEVYKEVFKPLSASRQPVHEFKKGYALWLVTQGYDVTKMIAIESNDSTKACYSSIGIKNLYTRDQFLAKFSQPTLFDEEI